MNNKSIILFFSFLLILFLPLCVTQHNNEDSLINNEINKNKYNYIFEITLEHEIIISNKQIINPTIETRIIDSNHHQTVLDYKWELTENGVTLEPDKYSNFSYYDNQTGKWDFNGTFQDSNISLKLFFTLETNNTYYDPEKEFNSLDHKFYLLASEGISSNDQRIIDLSKEIVQEATNDLDKLKKIYEYVSQMEYIYTSNPRGDSVRCLEQGGGDCTDKAFLLCALLRAQNIPARPVMGFIYGESIAHTWAEVYLGKWVTVDPTNMHLFFLPARYIKLSSGRGYYDLITFYYETTFPEAQIVKIKYLKFEIEEITDYN